MGFGPCEFESRLRHHKLIYYKIGVYVVSPERWWTPIFISGFLGVHIVSIDFRTCSRSAHQWRFGGSPAAIPAGQVSIPRRKARSIPGCTVPPLSSQAVLDEKFSLVSETRDRRQGEEPQKDPETIRLLFLNTATIKGRG